MAQKIREVRKLFLSQSGHLQEVLRGAYLSFVLRLIGAGLAFFLNALVARLLGAEGSGLYFLSLSVVMILSVVGRLGLDNTMLRFVAENVAREEWGRVIGVYNRVLTAAAIGTTVLVLFTIVASPWLAEGVFSKPELTTPLRFMSIGIFTSSFMMLISEALRGLGRIRDSTLISGTLYPLFGIFLIWPLARLMGASGAAITYFLATGLAAMTGLLLWRRAMSSSRATAVPFPSAKLRASSRPLFVVSIMNAAVLPWGPLFFLGIWGSAEESGIFGAAMRVSVLLSLPLIAVNTVLAPKYGAIFSGGDTRPLGTLARRSALIVTLLMAPVFLAFMFAGGWIMQVFGVEFIKGGAALAILALGQLVNSVTGSAGFLLVMSGHERDVRSAALVAGLVLLSSSIILIPSLGILGAALSSAFGLATDKIVSTWFVKRRLGIQCVSFSP